MQSGTCGQFLGSERPRALQRPVQAEPVTEVNHQRDNLALPYSGFDFDTYLKFWDLVAQRRTAGRSVLIISHFVTDEERFDRIVTLRDGKAVPR
jgi:ABC-type uncharacterized transport system ATPase subunit